MPDQIFGTAFRAVDGNGDPVPGAKLYVYRTGTTTPVTVTDEDGLPLSWPVEADGNGTFPQIFYDGIYTLKVVVTDPDDVVLPGYPIDPAFRIRNTAGAAEDITFTPTTDVAETNVQAAIERVQQNLDDALAFPGVSAAVGRVVLPNGITMQWGSAGPLGSGANGTVTFPAAFDEACYNVYLQYVNLSSDANVGDNWDTQVRAVSASGFTVRNLGPGTATYSYWAVGK